MPASIFYHHSLKEFNSWGVGGSCRILYHPENRQELAEFLSTRASHEPLLWLGLGSNVLIRDGGFDGTVIHTQGLAKLEEEGSFIIAEAGVTCAKLARFAARLGHEKAAFFAGIPGTVGGALAMNAGAFGGETWEFCVSVVTVDRQGRFYERSPEEFEVGYREVRSPHEEWFVQGKFLFPEGDAGIALQNIKTLLQKRNAAQPIGALSCGSVFRNPEGHYAAKLIENAGLKGHRIGGAVVSEKHANFIINDQKASAQDIESLIEFVQEEVFKKTGIRLKPECKIIGEFLS